MESFEDVFRHILPRAIRVAYRVLGNETQAEDAAAEALARAHASWKKIGATTYRDAWILRVTANVAVDMSRRHRWTFAAGLTVGDPSSVDDSAFEERMARGLIAEALASLPRRQREIIVLRYLEGLSEAEVAAALGISTGTVKKNAFRAREALRARIGDAFDASLDAT